MYSDIEYLPNNGTVIIPLSMASLNSRQAPRAIVHTIEFLTTKVQKITNDVIFLYTDGLYLNSLNSSIRLKSKLQKQMMDHKNGLQKAVSKNKSWESRAFHFLTWNQCLITCHRYLDHVSKLKKYAENNSDFFSCIKYDVGNRSISEENIQFILDEIVMSYFLRHRLATLPKQLSNQNDWNLIVYPGSCMRSEVYAEKHGLLPRRKTGTYSKATYNCADKILMSFEDYSLLPYAN